MSDRNRNNAVVPFTVSDVIVPDGFTENVELLIQTYAKDLTPQEFSLFVADAHERGLSIVKRQIYASKYGGKMTIMVGIDGYRSQAESHPDYAGQDGPYWCGPDGVWRDVWLEQTPPAAAKVGIYRRGFQAPVVGIATWAEYVNTSNPSWRKFPTTMLAKCAEAQAIRKAFPSKLGGTYVAEEMDQANAIQTSGRVVETDTGEIRGQQPTPIRATVSAPEPDERTVAVQRFKDAVESADVDERGVAAWIRSRLNEPLELDDITVATLTRWAELIERNPAGFHDHVEELIARFAVLDAEAQAVEASFRAVQNADSAVQDAEVVEGPQGAAQGSLTIEISEEEERQYRNKQRAQQAAQ